MSKATIKVVFDHLPQLSAAMRANASAVVRKTAFDIEGAAKRVVPVDTGALKNSIQASGLNGAELRPGDMAAEVNVGMEYGSFVEYGTHRAAAQPYMTPAAEGAKPGFMEAMKRIAKL